MDDRSVTGDILRTAAALADEVGMVSENTPRRVAQDLGRGGAQGLREACERLGEVCRGLEADAILARMRGQESAHVVVLETERRREVA